MGHRSNYYYNSILYALPSIALIKLLRVQNAAARFLTSIPKYYHIRRFYKNYIRGLDLIFITLNIREAEKHKPEGYCMEEIIRASETFKVLGIHHMQYPSPGILL